MEILIVTDSNTHNNITVSVKVLGDGVNDDISAVLEGLLEVGGHKGVVDNNDKVVLVSNLGQNLNIGDSQQGIGGSLEPEHLGLSGLDRVAEVLGVGEIGKGKGDVELGGNAHHVANSSTVEIVHSNNVVSSAQERDDGGSGSGSTSKGQTPLGTLEGGNVVLKGDAGGVAGASVLITLMDSRRGLLEGGRQGDGDNNGT
jgi:hypothetical protein